LTKTASGKPGAVHYLTEARVHALEGIVLLRFVLAADGAVLSARVIRGSGVASLDAEGRAMIARGTLPAAARHSARNDACARCPNRFLVARSLTADCRVSPLVYDCPSPSFSPRFHQMVSPPLLWPAAPQSTRILYLARFAPDDPIYAVKPEGITSGYAEYHFRIYDGLRRIGYHVASSSKPYAALVAGGNVDFVFSLLNRMPLRNPELLVPAICTYLRLPCLGAPPNIRALAEDKYLSKLAFAALGLPVAPGRVYLPGSASEPPDFAGPYFVKDRFGAASEGVTEASLQDSWEGVARVAGELHATGKEVLVERFCPGIDVTVPVLGLAPYLVLGHVAPRSDKVGGILTADLKTDDRLGNELIAVGTTTAAAIEQDVRAIWAALGPIDYFRLDYRWDPSTGQRFLIEMNICCYLGVRGAFGLAGERHGYDRTRILAHVVEYSLARQRGAHMNERWVI
jgi:D-alanine-D-alanine ligase